MPRFADVYIVVIKQTMLPRAPDCLFTVEDVFFIVSQTGLDEAQIQQWAKHFRSRVLLDDREKVLRESRPEQVLSYIFRLFSACFVLFW
jgi:hypothetical protein